MPDRIRIVSVAGKRCRLELPDGSRVEATLRGKLFDADRTNALVVGDAVTAAEHDGSWTVEAVQPRRNQFTRQGLRKERQILFANVDRVLIFASLDSPATKPASIDSFLVAALYGDIAPVLVLTKTDLDPQRVRELELRALYESFHLPVFAVSSKTDDGVSALAEFLTTGTTAVVGNSGVGKSSLLNRLIPGIDLVVREISAWSGKGTHATTTALLIPYREHTSFIDTPGIKSFVPYGITKENLAEWFPEIAALAPACRFRDCRHMAEPGCAVMQAVNEAQLPESRLKSYQRLFTEIVEPFA